MTPTKLKLSAVAASLLCFAGCGAISTDAEWPARYAKVVGESQKACTAGLAGLASGALSREAVQKAFEEGAKAAADFELYALFRPSFAGQKELKAERDAECGKLKEALK